MKVLSMKLGLVAILATVSFSVAANDGGIAYIEVQGVNPIQKTDEYGNTQVMEFYGRDIQQFMSILPPTFSVSSSMVPGYNESFKSLALVSNGYILYINCEAGEIQWDEDYRSGRVVPFARGPNCRISYTRRNPEYPDLDNYLGDATEFDKESMVCEQR